MTIIIERATAGRRAGRSCRRPAPRLRRARRCRRYVKKGELRVGDAPIGRGSKRFSGRMGGRALTPGRYRARLSATDAAGNRSRERSLAFRIVTGSR